MMTDKNHPGAEVPESDWNEQLIETVTQSDTEKHNESVPIVDVIREADSGDVAEQGIVVEIDDEDGYDDSAEI